MISERRTVRTLFHIIFLDQTYLTMTFPLVTLLFFDSQSRLFAAQETYATRCMWYGWCISLPHFINLFFTPVLSILSDRFGRKNILMIEVLSALLFTTLVGCGIYWGALGFIFFGFVIKGAFTRVNPTALAIIGDLVPRERKILYMGYLQFAISLGACLGPFIGGFCAKSFYFDIFNFSLPFFLGAILAAINTFIAGWSMPETLRKEAATRTSSTSDSINQVFHISLILILIQFSWSTYYQFIPPIVKTVYHFNSQQLGAFIGMIAFWLALTTGLIIKILHKFLNVRQMLLVSVYLILLGFFITYCVCAQILLLHTIWLWIGAIPIAAGDVIAYSCLTALYSNAVSHRHQGKVMGFGFIIAGAIWGVTGMLGGYCMRFSPLYPLIIAPLGGLLALGMIHAGYSSKLLVTTERTI